MVPPRPPTPVDGAQCSSPVFLQSNSATLRYQGGSVSSQAPFSSLVAPQTHYNMNTGNTSNMSSLLSQSFGNGGLSSGFSGSGSFQCGGTNIGAESNDLGYNPFCLSFATSNMVNPVSSNLIQNQQMSNPSGNQLMGQQQLPNQQLELQKFQQGQQSAQQFTLLHGQQQQHQSQQQRPQQYQSVRGGLKGFGPVSFEPQIINDQHGPQQQLQSSRNFNPVDPQQKQIGRGQGPVNIDPQVSNQQIFLPQQQQQQKQQFLQMLKPSSQPSVAQMNLLQHQQILQLQQQQHEQQQQRRMKTTSQPQYQLQQEVHHPNPSVGSPMRPVYQPGMGAQQLTHYIYQQRQRPNDNNIKFWRKFVADFFAPNAKKRWCVSLYGNSRQTSGVFPQDTWHCEICNVKPSRGFETTIEVLPRLYKIKYDSGTLEELLYVDMPREYQNTSGQIVLDYAKAIQECVFEQLHVVRDGRLRVVFSLDLKICSWEFCARHHEEIIPRRLIIPQVGQLGAASQKYQAAAQNASSSLSRPELQTNCNTFVASARQLAKALEVPLVNDLGYTKRYVRCLQISEVVNSMKDLIDYSQETGTGAMESLAKFPRQTSSLSRLHVSGQQPEGQLQLISGQDTSNDRNTVPATSQQQLTLGQSSKDDHNSVLATSVQLSACNVIASENESHGATSTATLATNIVGLLPQNSTSSRHENQMNNPIEPHAGTPVQIPSAGSSTTLATAHLNPSSPFSALTPSSSHNPPQASQNALPGAAPTAATATHIGSENSLAHLQLQQSSQSNKCPNESQSSVEKIIQEIMTSPRFSGMGAIVGVGSVGNNRELINGTTPVRSNSLGGGTANNAATNGVVNKNSAIGVARVGMPMMPRDGIVNHQQQEFANNLLNGPGSVDCFDNSQFDWK